MAAAAASTKVPLLMLAEKGENGEIREFFDLSSGITHSMNLPELAGKCCLGVGFPGWVFTADKQGDMNLFHIFTRTLINLPHMSMLEGYDSEEELGEVDCTDYVEKAVISADPLSSPTTDYVLGLIQGSPATFAFWRPGDTFFTSLGSTIPECAYSDITWYNCSFYGPNFRGDIVIFNFQHDDCGGARVVKGIPVDLIGCCQLYIVYLMGELLVIHRDGPISDEGQDTDQYGAKAFHVYKINDCNYEEIKDLGDRALFVGKSATLAMAIEDDQGSGCKRNHIYFTDDCVDSYFNLEQGGGKDMGVYSMVDGTIVPHYTGQSYHKVTPPLWV
ncbi:uncharacterized protein LOC125868866 [Solanum stenotomum]|uniref:uncharacterized protein LOC125868866 n=1 Tax=Solanum stenotomum TaxID=172797 RepID=UPI0020D15BAC|nr:uncharacterized protein LOC125868866 [Solanum stenotomum]